MVAIPPSILKYICSFRIPFWAWPGEHISQSTLNNQELALFVFEMLTGGMHGEVRFHFSQGSQGNLCIIIKLK